MKEVLQDLKALEDKLSKLKPIEKVIVASEFIKFLKLKGDEEKKREQVDRS